MLASITSMDSESDFKPRGNPIPIPAARKTLYFSNSLVSSFFAQKRVGLTNANVFGLTSRETEILRFICSGFSNKDIARRFQLSVRTVETHRLNIRKKTNAVRLRDLVNVGKQLGLVEPEITRMVEPPRLALA